LKTNTLNTDIVTKDCSMQFPSMFLRHPSHNQEF